MRTFALAAPLAALLLSGCLSLGGTKVPPTLFSLTAEAAPAAGAAASGSLAGAVVVVEPEAGQRLAVLRVPVQVDDANVAYLKDAQWVERPAKLLQRLIAETLRAKSNRVVLEEDTGEGEGVRLSGRLIDMGYDARSSSAVVRLEAMRELHGQVTTRRFESVVPGVEAKAAAVGPALNRAANEVARQVAEWVG